MANAYEIVLTANDRASAVISDVNTTLIGISTTVNTKIIPAFTAMGGAILSAVGVATDGFDRLIALIERTDSLLRRFAGTTLQDVVLGTVQNLVEGISDATQYSLTQVLGTVRDFGKAVAGIGEQAPTGAFVQQSELQAEKIKALARAAATEYDLVALKIEQLGQSGVDVALEFEKAKAKVTTLAKTLNIEVGQEVELLALRFQNLGDELGLGLTFDEELKDLNTITETELGLLELKLEQFAQGVGVNLEGEFNRSKARIQQIAAAFGTDATEELNRLAQGLNDLSSQQGLSLTFDPAPIQGAVEETQKSISELLKQIAAETASSVAGSIGILVDSFDRAFFRLSELAANNIERIKGIGEGIAGFSFALSGVDEVFGVFEQLQGVATPILDGISQIGFQLQNLGNIVDALNPIIASGPFQLLIQQNITLQEQLLATQASLVGTNKVFESGLQITDPLQAIKALQGPVEDAIAQIREGSLELAGVTSSQLIDVFQVVATEVGNVGLNLQEAADLTLDFSAAFSTLGIPLAQAGQEIGSILSAQIDQNSVLARRLNLSNEEIRNYQTQGQLLEFLRGKLEAFRAGNAELAQTFSGVTSNIQEQIELIGLEAGQGLLDPLVAEMNKVYEFLQANRETITATVKDIAEGLFAAVQNLAQAIGSLFGQTEELLGNSVEIIFTGVTTAINALASAIETAGVVFQPFISALTSLSSLVPSFLTPLVAVGIQAKILTAGFGLLTGGFQSFAKGIPIVGELLFLFEQRSSGLIGLLTGLTQATNVGAAGFLTFGANLTKIPFLFNQVAGAIPIFGQQIAGVIPLLSQFGIAGIGAFQQLSGIAEKSPALKAALDGVAEGFGNLIQGKGGGGLPQVLDNIKQFAESNEFLKPLAPTIEQTTEKIKTLAQGTDIAAVANAKFAETMKLVRQQVIATAIRITLIGAAIFAAFKAFDQFVLKNEELLTLLSQIGQGLASFARDITNFIISPFGLVTIAIGGATAALIAFGTTIKTQLLASAIPSLVAALGKLAALFQGLTTAATVLGAVNLAATFSNAAVALTAVAQAAAAGTLSLKLLAVAFGEVALAAAAALAPFALIVAAIAAIGLIRYTKDLAEQQEALDSYTATANVFAQSAISFLQRYKGLREEQKRLIEEGRELTEEDRKALEAAKRRAGDQISNLEDQIKTLQEAQKETKNDDLKAAYQAQIDSLSKLRDEIKGYATELELAGDPVAQLTNRVKFFTEELERLGNTVDANSKEQLANLTERLAQGLETQRSLEDQRVQITREGLEQQLSETQEALNELNRRYAELAPEEQARAKEVQDGITSLRAQAADLRIQILESEIEEERKLVDRAAQDAIDASTNAEKQRQIQVQSLRNQGLLGEADAQATLVESTKQRINAELAAEQTRLAQLEENAGANEEAIKASKQRILDLTLESLKAEEEAYDAHLARIESALDRQIQDYELGIREAVNAGVIGEAEAERERARLRVSRIQTELRDEKLRASRRRELLLELADAERELQQANSSAIREQIEAETIERETALQRQINSGLTTERQAAQERARLRLAGIQTELQSEELTAERRRELLLEQAQAEREVQLANSALIEERLTQQAQAYENLINAQNQKLEAQASLYEAIGQALQVQNGLLTARNNVLQAGSDFLQTSLNALGDIENSEFRRQELAQTTALIQLESLQQRQALETQIFEIQLEQNRLALERQQIENEIAIAQSEANIARGQAELLAAQRQLASGEITPEEFDARVAEQQANIAELAALQRQGQIIQRQQETLPLLEQAQRQQQRLEQQGEAITALTGFFQTLRSGQQAQLRGDVQDLISGLLGFEDYGDLRTNGRQAIQEAVSQIEGGGGLSVDTGLFRGLAPNSQRIAQGLEQAGTQPIQFEQFPQFSDQFYRNIERIEQLQQETIALNNRPVTAFEGVQLGDRPLPVLQLPQQLQPLPSAQQQQQQNVPEAFRGLSPQEIGQQLSDAFWERFSGFGDGVVAPQSLVEEARRGGPATVVIEAPISLNVQEAQNLDDVEEQVVLTIENAVNRANLYSGLSANTALPWAGGR